MSLLSEWLENLKNVLLRPTEFYGELEATDYRSSARFIAISGLVIGIPLAILSIGTGVIDPSTTILDGILAAAISVVILPVALVTGAFMQSILVHAAVYLFGGDDLEFTFTAVSYATGSTAILGWIPFLNVFASIYSLYLQYRGVKKLHRLSTSQSIVAVVWPVILSIAISFMVLLAVLAASGLTMDV